MWKTISGKRKWSVIVMLCVFESGPNQCYETALETLSLCPVPHHQTLRGKDMWFVRVCVCVYAYMRVSMCVCVLIHDPCVCVCFHDHCCIYCCLWLAPYCPSSSDLPPSILPVHHLSPTHTVPLTGTSIVTRSVTVTSDLDAVAGWATVTWLSVLLCLNLML